MAEKVYRVKPLVWEDYPPGAYLRASAETVFGEFRIFDMQKSVELSPHFEAQFWNGDESLFLGGFDQRIDAKAAAQRDYEARLIAAGVIEEVERG